jgi:hypothetical protein
MTQKPLAANHTIAPPTKSVNRLPQGLNRTISAEATEMLKPTARLNAPLQIPFVGPDKIPVLRFIRPEHRWKPSN